ncbi:MAG: hypothetical protein QW096_10300 [Thermofilaceae archaeon]
MSNMVSFRKEYLMIAMLGTILALAALNFAVPGSALSAGEQYYTVVMTRTLVSTVTEERVVVSTLVTTLTSPVTEIKTEVQTYTYPITVPMTITKTTLVELPIEVIPLWAWIIVVLLSVAVAVLLVLILRKSKAG